MNIRIESMQNTKDDVKRLEEEFKNCQKILTALGDETRQHLLLIMMMEGECNGNRVIEIAKQTNLSRPAVSHHMQILKDAGIVKTRKEGTYVYYYLEPETTKLESLIRLFKDVKTFMENVPDRSGDGF